MLALTLGQAKTIGILVVIALVALALFSAWVMNTVAQKAAVAVILCLLAAQVWTHRSSLDDCAAKVRAGGVQVDTTCSFFGSDIKISTQRSS